MWLQHYLARVKDMKEKNTMIEIDGAKLRAEIEKRNLSFTGLSKEIGHSHGYIGTVIARQVISPSTVKLLKTLYNIDLDSYKIQKPEPIPEQLSFIDELKKSEPLIDYDRLWKVIYTAVFEAIKKARGDE